MLTVALILATNCASAANWIFLPSYYSHEPAQKVKVGPPQEYGGPYYTRPVGDYYRGSYRVQVYRLPNADGSYDTTYYYEGNRQIGAQY